MIEGQVFVRLFLWSRVGRNVTIAPHAPPNAVPLGHHEGFVGGQERFFNEFKCLTMNRMLCFVVGSSCVIIVNSYPENNR